MRHFNRVFLSITLLLGTVFAGAVLPAQAAPVGPLVVNGLYDQAYTETITASTFDVSATWSTSVPNGETGTYFVQVDTNPGSFPTIWSAPLPIGICTVAANSCGLTGVNSFGVPDAYPENINEARYRITLLMANWNQITGNENKDHVETLILTDTYISIDESSTTYGDEITLAGFVLAETDTVSLDTGTIYFYDLGSAPFTDGNETITGGDTSTAIGSCTPSSGEYIGSLSATYAYPHHWSGGCEISFPTSGANGKFHYGDHHFVAKYVDYTGGITRHYGSSWSDASRNFNYDEFYGELPYANLHVAKAELTFSPDDINITYGEDIPSYASSNVAGFVYNGGEGETEDISYVFNGTNWGNVNLPECTSDYANNSEAGSVGDYPITCDVETVENYDYTYNSNYGEPNLAVDYKSLTVTPNNQTIVYGDAVPEDPFYTASYDGFVNGETQTVLDPDPVFGTDYAEDTAAGSLLPITSTDFGPSGNYDITVETGTLTITKAPLHIYAPKYNYTVETPTANSVDYSPYTVIYSDEAIDFTTLGEDTVFVGFKNGEDVEVITGFACSSDYDNFTHVGDAAGALIGCTGTSSNYAITFHDGAYLVNPATLDVYSPDNISVPRGTVDVIYPYNVEGFKNSESQFNALDYHAPSCGSGYTPESATGLILPIICSGLTANDYVAVYETGTALSIQGPAAFPTTTNLSVLPGSETIYPGDTITVRAIVCAGANAHPTGEGYMCPSVTESLVSTILPTSAVLFTLTAPSTDETPVGFCTLLGTFSNHCDLDILTPSDIETGTYVIKAYYYGTNQWGSSTSETRSVEILDIPVAPLPYSVTYHLTNGAESGTVYVETGTAGAWTAKNPNTMGSSFTSYASGYTFNYWVIAPGSETITAGGSASLGAGDAAHLYGNWTIKSSGGGGYVPPASVTATISVTSSTVTYNGASHGVTATTSPAGLAVTITYNGSTTQPTNAGTYAVVATITSAGYTGTATGTLVINKATPTIAWSSPASVEEGTTLSGAQLNAVGSVPGTLTYSPAAGYTPSVGSNTLSVTLNPTDSTNWNNASASVVLSVTATAVEPTPDPAPAPVLKNLVLSFKLSSAKISAADLAKISAAALDNVEAVITIVGYAQPSGNKAADLKLSRARANAVKAQILALYPDATITIIAKGSAINKACKKSLNKCAIVSVG